MPGFRPDVSDEALTRARAERAILILLAGPAAEARFTGRQNRAGAASDSAAADDLAFRMIGDEEEAGKYLDWLKVRARNLVASSRPTLSPDPHGGRACRPPRPHCPSRPRTSFLLYRPASRGCASGAYRLQYRWSPVHLWPFGRGAMYNLADENCPVPQRAEIPGRGSQHDAPGRPARGPRSRCRWEPRSEAEVRPGDRQREIANHPVRGRLDRDRSRLYRSLGGLGLRQDLL